jgi:hypothetical protein
MEKNDDVEATFHGPPVARLLVPAVAEVARVTNDGERKVRGGLLIAEPDQIGAVLTVVVTHQDVGDSTAKRRGDAVQQLRESGCGVVRHNKDADPLHGTTCERRGRFQNNGEL